MPASTFTLAIERNAPTQNAADNKLETALIRFVSFHIPNVREVRRTPAFQGLPASWEASEYDFYLRDAATGAILQTQGGKDRIRANALQNAAARLMREHFKDSVSEMIRREEAAANAAALQAKLDADD
jgi:hypothetical protein